MSDFSGFVQAGLQLGLNSVLFKINRGIFNPTLPDGTTLPDIIAQATIEEHHIDEMEITEHPVQQGAMVTDHAFKRPAEVTLHLGWSNSPSSSGSLVNSAIAAAASVSPAVTTGANVYGLASGVMGLQSALDGSAATQIAAIYQSLLQLQESRALFDLYTGKRAYHNMICKTLSTTTDAKSEHSLPITMVCKQIILVNTQLVSLPAATQADPSATASPVNKGTQSVSSVSSAAQAKLLNSLPKSVPGVD